MPQTKHEDYGGVEPTGSFNTKGYYIALLCCLHLIANNRKWGPVVNTHSISRVRLIQIYGLTFGQM